MPYRSWKFRIDDIIEAINKIERIPMVSILWHGKMMKRR